MTFHRFLPPDKTWLTAGTLLLMAPLASFATTKDCGIPSLVETVEQARQNVMQLRQDGTHWNVPSYLGSHYVSQYYLILRFLNRFSPEHTSLNTDRLKEVLLQNQLPDGSWFTVKDANLKTGDLNASIFNYWALKAMGVTTDSDAMARAAQWIRTHGGLESGSLFTKIFLALLGVGTWTDVPEIPYLIFKDWSPFNDDDFAQWVSPHLLPIAYLKKMRVSYTDNLLSNLDELRNSRSKVKVTQPRRPKRAETKLISKMLENQQPRGSFGAYTSATLFTILAFDHFQKNSIAKISELEIASARGLRFIEWMMIESGESAYKGVVDDGRYWDTALLGIALHESGTDPEELASTANYLINEAQTKSGGFAFGEDFWYAPDTDDTAEILLLLARTPGNAQKDAAARRAVEWLMKMQNSDGGWGAFARNNNGHFILEHFTRGFLDSADLFDESSVDVTGHIIEALSVYGLNARNSKAVRKAVQYILKNQEESGSWMGRWGINHLYGTSAAVVGLLSAGLASESEAIHRAINWLVSVQNSDGGFGEASASYVDHKAWGKGISTPSQTAWALQALIAAGRANSHEAIFAAQYLVREFQNKRMWEDPSTVGTGHPVIVYMNYPSYPLAFPLIALSRYLHACD